MFTKFDSTTRKIICEIAELKNGEKNFLTIKLNQIEQHIHSQLIICTDTLKSQIYKLILQALEVAYSQEKPIILDFILTVRDILSAFVGNKKKFKKNLENCFLYRDQALVRDELGYNFCRTLTNSLCVSVVRVVFSSENPQNILLKDHIINKSRQVTWRSVCSGSEQLPEFKEFFIGANGTIELYDEILSQVITNLKSGFTSFKEVFLGSDYLKNCTNYSLKKSDLNILKQRTETFNQLVEYVFYLDNYVEDESSCYKKLLDLRKNLKRNDEYNGIGEADAAGEEIYVGLEKFAAWWNNLTLEVKTKILNINGMKRCLDDLFVTKDKDEREKRFDYPGPCIGQTGESLEVILYDQENRKILYEVSGLNDHRLANKYLDLWERRIIDELENFPKSKIDTGHNINGLLLGENYNELVISIINDDNFGYTKLMFLKKFGKDLQNITHNKPIKINQDLISKSVVSLINIVKTGTYSKSSASIGNISKHIFPISLLSDIVSFCIYFKKMDLAIELQKKYKIKWHKNHLNLALASGQTKIFDIIISNIRNTKIDIKFLNIKLNNNMIAYLARNQPLNEIERLNILALLLQKPAKWRKNKKIDFFQENLIPIIPYKDFKQYNIQTMVSPAAKLIAFLAEYQQIDLAREFWQQILDDNEISYDLKLEFLFELIALGVDNLFIEFFLADYFFDERAIDKFINNTILIGNIDLLQQLLNNFDKKTGILELMIFKNLLAIKSPSTMNPDFLDKLDKFYSNKNQQMHSYWQIFIEKVPYLDLSPTEDIKWKKNY